MILVPDSPVKFKRSIIAAIHFEMDGVHAQLAGFFFEKRNCLRAISAAAEGGVNIQLVDKGVMAVKLKAETNGQHNVADRRASFGQKPDLPKGRKGQEPTEGRASCRLVKLDFSRLLLGKQAHHAQEIRFILERGFPDRELRHVTHRFVQLVLQPDLSSRFDGLRRPRRHCRRESIRRKG